MSKKKIIYVWKSPYPWDVRVEKICKSLSKDYEVLILARWGNEKKKAEQIDGITVKRVGYREKSYKSTPISANPIWKKELISTIEGFKPDLIIVREIMLGTLVGKLAKKYNIPSVMDMAENYPALMKIWRKYNNTLFKKFIMQTLNIPTFVEKNSLKYIDYIIVVCKEQIERLSNTYNYDKKNIVIIKNTPKLKKNNKEINIRKGKVIFLHHGWLTEEKRIDNFISAFAKTYANNSKYLLKIAGSGNCLEEYKSIAKSVENIIFTGEYQHNELDEMIEECTIGILPYESNDFNNYTIHNKLFDYFSHSKPVLVSQVHPLQRIVQNTNSGYIIDCSSVESIHRFLNNNEFEDIEPLSQNAYKAYKEKYNWDVDEKKLLNFISEVI